MRLRYCAVFFLLTASVLVVGCGGPTPVDVTGNVTLDGQPLSEGDIIFEAADGKVTPGAGPIKEGKFAIKALPGAKKVKINASKPAKPDPVMGTIPGESIIPEQYNVKTKLTADVQKGQPNDFTFDLKSKP